MSIDRNEKAAITQPDAGHTHALLGDTHAPKIAESKTFSTLSKNIGSMGHDDLAAQARKLASSGQDLDYLGNRANNATGIDGESKERMQKMAMLAKSMRPGGADMRLVYHY